MSANIKVAIRVRSPKLNNGQLVEDSCMQATLKSIKRNCELRIRQDLLSVNGTGLAVVGVTERNLSQVEDYMNVLLAGGKNRTVAETSMNSVSSRSHAILTLTIDELHNSTDGNEQKIGVVTRKSSKIHLVDLADSERADSTGATGQRLKEGAAINQSLSCLGNVINALATEKSHIPYRDSKSTYLLSDSLGGNSLTLMIACLNPTSANHDESTSTLRFAERVKKVKNNAVVNIDPAMKRIMELESELALLKSMLARCKCDANHLTALMDEENSNNGKRAWMTIGRAVTTLKRNGKQQSTVKSSPIIPGKSTMNQSQQTLGFWASLRKVLGCSTVNLEDL